LILLDFPGSRPGLIHAAPAGLTIRRLGLGFWYCRACRRSRTASPAVPAGGPL